MKRNVLLPLILVFAACTHEEKSNFTHEKIALGENNITLVQHTPNSESNILFVNLHENETTSIEALEEFSKDHSLNYVYLSHSGERRITFQLETSSYSIDPNRIFTDTGRENTLIDGGNHSEKGEREVKVFASRLLKEVHGKEAIIAMHNNTEDNYSILSYLPEGDEAKNTKLVHVNEKMDPDDFIYTTDEEIYEKMVEHDINVILQDNTNFVDDGSLSVYCGIKGIRYINIETQHGHLKEQLELMELLQSIVHN